MKKTDSVLKLVVAVPPSEESALHLYLDVGPRHLAKDPAETRYDDSVHVFFISIKALRDISQKQQHVFSSAVDKCFGMANYIECPPFKRICCGKCWTALVVCEELCKLASRGSKVLGAGEEEESIVESFCDHNPALGKVMERAAAGPTHSFIHIGGALQVPPQLKTLVFLPYSAGLQHVCCQKCGNLIGTKTGEKVGLGLDRLRFEESAILPGPVLKQMLSEYAFYAGIIAEFHAVLLGGEALPGKKDTRMIRLRLLDCMAEAASGSMKLRKEKGKQREVMRTKRCWKVIYEGEKWVDEIAVEALAVSGKGRFVSEEVYGRLKAMLNVHPGENLGDKTTAYIDINSDCCC